MKLLTHNLMTSKCVKGVLVGFPLGIVANEVKQTKVDFNPDFIARMIPKLDWDALCQAASSIGCSEDLPKTLAASYENDEEFLKKAHHVLLEVEVVSGELICPETGRKFPISPSKAFPTSRAARSHKGTHLEIRGLASLVGSGVWPKSTE